MVKKLFEKLYRLLFGDGQAYKSPLHYEIADALKTLAGLSRREKLGLENRAES